MSVTSGHRSRARAPFIVDYRDLQGAGRRRGPPRPGGRGREQPGQDLGAVHVVVHDEDPLRGRARRSAAAPGGLAAGVPGRPGPGRGAGGRRTRCPCPSPSLRRVDAAAVHLDQAADQGQADAEPPLGAVERAVGLGEQVEDAREQLRGDPDAGVADPDDRLVALSAGLQRDPAPRLGVLGGVVQQVGEDLLEPGRVGLAGARLRGERDRQLVAAGLDQRPGGLDGAGDGLARGRPAPCGAGSCRVLIRETSSRSSTSRARCRTCRSAIVRRLLGRPASSAPSGGGGGRSGSGARGLRSSWASIARNSSLRRSASRISR